MDKVQHSEKKMERRIGDLTDKMDIMMELMKGLLTDKEEEK